MRLGSYKCKLDKNSISYQLYKNENIKERHRHRYEFNNKYRKEFPFITLLPKPETRHPTPET